jgi:hypothetical protein
LPPIDVNHFSLGAQLWNDSRITASLQAYEKRYSHEPVSTEYPGLMLANMVDTLGQQIVWLPLRDGGHGKSAGLELMLRAHTASRFQGLGSFTWSRTRYAAADGVFRPGNFDFPVVANGLVSLKLSRGFELSAREGYATGRPYTPFNIALSEAQSRGIYDLTKINAVRGAAYNRLDVVMNRDFHLWRKTFNLRAGADNVLNRYNFLGYVWLDSCHPRITATTCGMDPIVSAGIPEELITQMHVFPEAALRYAF